MANTTKSALRVDPDLYSASLSHMAFTPKEARTEYSRLARLANARLDVLERHGMGDAASLRKFPAEFKALPKGASESQVRKALATAAHFVGLKTTSYKGVRAAQKAAVETMREHGYDFITMENIEAYGRFMEAAKKHANEKGAGKKSFRSEVYLEDFEALWEDEKIDPKATQEAFDKYMETGDLQEIQPKDGAEIVRETSGKQLSEKQREKRVKQQRQQRRERARSTAKERQSRQGGSRRRK